jgi:cytochrome bd-type quinol oxidase subunit 1/cytochrome c5
MDYPLFLVPYVGGSWLIGGNAILHVIIAHFAVGGGLLIVVTEQLAARRGDLLWLEFARKQSVFLVLISTVLGALTGVGIWFTIGLVHPAATASLIHNFVWGWAIEWVFFVVEIAAALLYVATWDRVSRRLHIRIGWVYFAGAYLSLVIINGIVTFMLTPGRWLETRAFWDGFFNPTYWPSLVLRTGIALLLAGVYGWLVAGRLPEEPDRPRLVRYLSGWVLAGVVVSVAGFTWWQAKIPAEAAALVFPTGSLLRATYVAGIGALVLLILLVIGVAYLFPRGFGLPAGIAALVLAGILFGAYERIREGGRKPFVIYGYMYSNGVRVEEVERLNREGILHKAHWAGPGLAATPASMGEQVFRAQCQMCHSLDGYLAITPLVEGQDAEGLAAFLEALRAGRPGMPPIVGIEEEIKALATYLASQGGRTRQAGLVPEGAAR